MPGLMAECPICNYPVTASPGETISCPNCGNSLSASISDGVTIPTWLVVGLVAFGAGVFLGPALLTSTTEGQRWLEDQVRGKLR